MLEVLTAVGIIGVLVALLLPAVQSSRESARRIQCASNLRQVGLGLQAHESVHGEFPAVLFHVDILPYIEQGALHQEFTDPANLNMSARVEIAERSRVPLYLCPSDLAGDGVAATNYMCNFGSGSIRSNPNGFFRAFPQTGVRASEIVDGLSTTAAVSEALLPVVETRLRIAWRTIPYEADLDALADRCERLPADPAALGYSGPGRGAPWAGWTNAIWYNHLLPPNRPSCTNNAETYCSIYNSSSMHPGGVLLLYGDGHVTFENEAIDRAVWREIGSRIARANPE